MKVKRKVFGGALEIEVEGSTEKELFKGLAETEELFGVSQSWIVEKCGLCGSKELRFRVREVGQDKKGIPEFTYYELNCKNPKCYAKLPFGQKKKGDQLFPKKVEGGDRDGKYWEIYKKEDEE